MNYFKKIIRYALPYKKYGILNIICNIFYALFGTLAMLSLFPMLRVLFNKTEQLTVEPEFTGLKNIGKFVEDYLNYFVTQRANEGAGDALLFMIILVISTFLIKNIFGYLSMYFITFLRNGIIKDIRNDLYKKTLVLPISFFSEKQKGDTMSRITSDVNEIQSSFLSILEMFIKEPLTILFALVTMIIISPQLTLFVFIFIPISGYL
ncbi:MAG TPA: antibiotic ABC transporter ATP-binding protein, partial [Flavobacteriaceae bacterium]|nr:antibiotic ABC transporter ATP-binding protein [Flavobacteriaceae bacterium]